MKGIKSQKDTGKQLELNFNTNNQKQQKVTKVISLTEQKRKVLTAQVLKSTKSF